MRITETVTHPIDVMETFAMVTDESYQQLRCERAGSSDHSVHVEHDGGDTVVTTQRHLPTDEFPDFARALVGPSILVVETVRWGDADADGEREGAMSVDLPGTPVSFTGGVHLRRGPDGASTLHVVDGDLEANVPLLGRRIEAAVAPQISSIVQIEEQVAREWLSRR